MLKNNGGDRVGKGTYWNFTTGERVTLDSDGTLPGNRDAEYLKIPAAGILAAGPLLGLLYAVFLPFIGIAMLVTLVGQKALAGVANMIGSTVSFGWRPLEAYLGGKKKKGEKAKKDETKKGDNAA